MLSLDGIDWVIVGGELGIWVCWMEKDWVMVIYYLFFFKGIFFFFKQWGCKRFNFNVKDLIMNKKNELYVKGGCEFDGKVY